MICVILSSAEETAKTIVAQGAGRVGLTGTKFTLGSSFFRDRLARLGNDRTGGEARDFIHASILGELTNGIFKPEAKNKYLEIIEKLCARKTKGVVLNIERTRHRSMRNFPVNLACAFDCLRPA